MSTPWLRLFQVELRKQVDTRAGIWLLAVLGLVSAALAVLTLTTSDPAELTFQSLALSPSLGLMALLPLIGVLAATSEWSQRTALTTFALEPRRTRVNLAKLVSAWVLAAGVLVLCLGVGALLNVVGRVWWQGNGAWQLDEAALAGTALTVLLLVTQGVAFGLALLSTPTAIVLYFVLPTAWSLVAAMVNGLERPARWLDLNVTVEPLLSGNMAGKDWAQLSVSLALWVGLPLGLGLWRTARRDVQ